MSILIIADHNNGEIFSATLSAIAAATEIGDQIDLLVAGHDCLSAAEAATQIESVSKVICADSPSLDHQLAEGMASVVVGLARNYSHVLAAASANGKDLVPRVAALLDVGMISDITAVESEDTFKRPIYAGNAVATVQSLDAIKVLTVRVSAFEAVSSSGGSAELEKMDVAAEESVKSSFVREEVAQSNRPELTDAKIVISGGRGLESSENFEKLFALADKLGAAVGASRAAVDAGYVPNDMQVGQTGKIVAPDLYIAMGISGAIQHLAGMKESKVIVAVNKDEDAPIFQVADYGLVADLFEVIEELNQAL